MQHAIMTLNNASGAEIMTGENINHIQVSCTALILCERNKLNTHTHTHTYFIPEADYIYK